MISPPPLERIVETHDIRSEADVMSCVIAAYTTAQQLSFEASLVSEIATAVSELAMNVVKYAVEGQVVVFQIEQDGGIGLKIVVKDCGQGIADIEQALKEQFSTGDSLGMGLPGVVRMMDEFDIQSSVGKGTTVTIVKWKD